MLQGNVLRQYWSFSALLSRIFKFVNWKVFESAFAVAYYFWPSCFLFDLSFWMLEFVANIPFCELVFFLHNLWSIKKVFIIISCRITFVFVFIVDLLFYISLALPFLWWQPEVLPQELLFLSFSQSGDKKSRSN